MKNILVLLMFITSVLFAQTTKSEVLPERDHTFSLEKKAEYTSRYADKNVIDETHPNKFRMHAVQLLEVITQEGASEFVMELGTNADGITVPIYSAADKNGNALAMNKQLTFLCPPRCAISDLSAALKEKKLRIGSLSAKGGRYK